MRERLLVVAGALLGVTRKGVDLVRHRRRRQLREHIGCLPSRTALVERQRPVIPRLDVAGRDLCGSGERLCRELLLPGEHERLAQIGLRHTVLRIERRGPIELANGVIRPRQLQVGRPQVRMGERLLWGQHGGPLK